MTAEPEKENLPRLLLVDDSETSAAVLARYLRGRYEVRHAHDGEQAWKILLIDRRIELVVTDIQMPRMTGHELLIKIRSSSIAALRSLPVIVMTTANDSRDRNLAFEGGANDFVTKPVDAVELQARVAVHHKLASTIRELEASRKLLQEQASTDPLTRLKNRRAFFDIGGAHFALARAHKTDLSLIALDVDHFKRINDNYGHQVGDHALIAIADMLAGNVRKSPARPEDVVARIGGEEFAILLPDTNRLGAVVVAERIRGTIEKAQIATAEHALALTVSMGIASYGADRRDNLEQLLGIADRRLYRAKQGGRNRVVANDDGQAA